MTGQLALVFDDGYAADADLVKPILERYGAPATLAIVPDWLGGEGNLSNAELDDLADAGWEVAAHGVGHRYLGARRLTVDAAVGDTAVTVSGHVSPGEGHAVLDGDGFELTDGDRVEEHVVAETVEGEAGPQLVFEDEIRGDFAADEAVVHPDEPTLGEEVVDSKDALEEMGYAVSSFVFPYDAASPRAWELASDTYDAIPNAGVRSLPNPEGTEKTNLRRYYLQTSHLTDPEIDDYLDSVADGRTGILAGHSSWDSVTEARLAYVLDGAEERDIEVTTVAEL